MTFNYLFQAPFVIFAHRGASGYEPENTLRGFSRALEMGAQAIELDVWFVEGRLVVFHDRRLERLTDGEGNITDLTLDALSKLTVNSTEEIPFLEDVLDYIAGRCAVNIEIKGPGAAPAVVEIIERYTKRAEWSLNHFLVSSFDHPALASIQQSNEQIPRGLLVYGVLTDAPSTAQALGCKTLNLAIDFLKEEDVHSAHEKGLRVFVYTVNHMDDAQRLRTMKVDGIFTDYLDRMIR